MGRIVDVKLIGYLGITEVACITVDTFFNLYDANVCIEHLEEYERDDIAELKDAIEKFIGVDHLLFLYKKKERS